MRSYDRLAELPLAVDGYELERREAALSPDFTRVTTTIVLGGGGETGRGEDVVYQSEAHDAYPDALPLAGAFTLAGFSEHLGTLALFPGEPRQAASPDYRRWAFESAALDLALRQRGVSLGAALGRAYRPVRFVVSTRKEIWGWHEHYPALEYKLDPTSDWDDGIVARLAATGRVRVLDLKGQYHGTVVDQPPDAELYRRVVEAFPDAIVEDAALTEETRTALAGADGRLSWDAPVHSVEDVVRLGAPLVNVKPSRFGTVERLLDAIDHCEREGIAMYGGGQSENGVGRRHIQVLASLFYADAPNDVAPRDYNLGEPRPGLPESPLPPPEAVGF